MIKVETIGQIEVAKLNPVLTSENDVANYSFLVNDEDLYLISNTIVGDDAYAADVVIPAGDYLNGFLVKAWEGQKLVVDLKHIDGDAPAKDDILVADEATGMLKAGDAAGVHFKVTDVNVTLTGPAVKVKVMVA